MTSLILKCKNCGKYGLNNYCDCGGERISTKPAKFSVEDKYAKYRLDYKKKSQNL